MTERPARPATPLARGATTRQATRARPAPTSRPHPDARPGGATGSFRFQFTARGALLGMFALCLVSCLVSAAWGIGVLAGLGYCAAGVLAPLYVRREALLQVVLAPPAIFLVAVLFAQAFTAQGDSAHGTVLSVLEGTFLMLSGAAPWLLAGTAVAVSVATYRGLPQCVREFRATLRGEVVVDRSARR
ncbi:MAG TPA: DUF6542 domain-containing protein [Streptosporangiaceae bacterium]